MSLLEEVPSLATGLAPEDLAVAGELLQVDELKVNRGDHEAARFDGDARLGLIVLDGWLIRSVELAGRTSGVLIGPGAFVRPFQTPRAVPVVPFHVRWRAVQPTRLAILDARASEAVGRWPALMMALIERAMERASVESFASTMRSLVHVELRLQTLMWFYADMYGHRTPEGVVFPVRLGHRDLADLVSGQRPSVSAHLARLAARGEIIRRPDRTWLLAGTPPTSLEDLRVRGGSGP